VQARTPSASANFLRAACQGPPGPRAPATARRAAPRYRAAISARHLAWRASAQIGKTFRYEV
jgi:hypothetical protein